MADTDDTKLSAINLLLQIVRENGLVVLALVALLYQVYILINYSSSQQTAWRVSIDSLKNELLINRETMLKSITELDKTLVRVTEIQRVNQRIIADMEEECKYIFPVLPSPLKRNE